MKILIYSTNIKTSEISEIKHFAKLNDFSITRLSQFFWLYAFECAQSVINILNFISISNLGPKAIVVALFLSKNRMTQSTFRRMFSPADSGPNTRVLVPPHVNRIILNTQKILLNNNDTMPSSFIILKSLLFIFTRYNSGIIDKKNTNAND